MPRRRRRANNEGSIYQRDGKGAYIASVSITQNGERRRLTRRFAKHADAAAWIAGTKAAEQQGRLVTGGNQTVRDYLAHWIEHVRGPKLNPRSLVTYRTHLGNIVPIIGDTRMSDLTPEAIEAAYTMLRNGDRERFSVTTIAQIHAICSMAFTAAAERRHIYNNPFKLVDLPRKEKYEIHPYTSEHIERLLATSHGAPWHALWAVLGLAGLRIAEACALTWDAVDIERALIHVRCQVQNVRGQGLVVCDPKTPGSKRTVDVGRTVIDALEMHRTLPREIVSPHIVFPNRHGGYLRTSQVRDEFIVACHRAGIPQRRLHDLRHTYVTLCLQTGQQAHDVMANVGHTSYKTFWETYAHSMPVSRQSGAALLDALVKGTAEAPREAK